MALTAEFTSKEKTLAVLGLGYVGLPIALAFATRLKVIGFDIDQKRVDQMRKGIDPSREIPTSDFTDKDIYFTADFNDLAKANFYVVAVPTPVDQHKIPNLGPLKKACDFIGQVLKKGDYVIFESTVYPGCTEEDCIPILEEASGLKAIEDFKYGYSPERINPGDKLRPINKIAKVVSGCDQESLELIAQMYELIIDAQVFKASCVKVAEAAKIIENTQRDLNIALMNELAIIFERMDIDIWEVLEAASTKWNFSKFHPGLVGGHCIGVDPYYLLYKAKEVGYDPEVILSGRRINDEMSSYVSKKAVQFIIRAGKFISKSKVLVMGATFKENISDIRNSKVADLVKELEAFSIAVDVTDPHGETEALEREYGISFTEQIKDDYDCVIVAVAHQEYVDLDEAYFTSISSENGILIDIKGMYKGKIHNLKYWTL